MSNLALDQCPHNHMSNDLHPKEIVIYGPTYVDRHPYSPVLETELNKYGWSTWFDGIGRLCASHICLWPFRAGGHA